MSSTAVLLETSQPPHELGMVARHSVHADDARADRRLKDAVRRYYALAELIETERGYVDDLRILVEVSTNILHLVDFFLFFLSFLSWFQFHLLFPTQISLDIVHYRACHTQYVSAQLP